MRFSRVCGLLLFGMLVMVLAVAESRACSCASGGPVCQSFFNTQVIFSGRVTSITSASPKPDGGIDWTPRKVTFAVSAHYRGGGIEQSVDVYTGQGGGDCGYRFEVGKDYLVYAYEHEKRLATGICNPTKPLDSASEDLEFISSLSSAKPSVGFVFGTVREYKPRRSEDYRPPPTLSGVTVALSSKDAKYSAVSDADGKFRLSDIPAGDYVFTVTSPEGYMPPGEGQIKVPEKGCVAADPMLSRETSVSGRVIDADAQPVTNLMVDLVPIEEIDAPHQQDRKWAHLDENGAYKFTQIPPGSYYLGLGLGRWTSTKHPFPKTFYPGTQDISKAAIVIIREGGVTKDLDFQLPRALKERMVTGHVVFPDGKPAAGANLLVKEGGLNDVGGATAGKDGKFMLKLFEGLSYKVRAVVDLPSGQRHAEWIEIPPADPLKGFKIVITEANGNCSRCLRN